MVVKKNKETETVQNVTSEKIEETVAEKLWSKIKDLPIDIFALPNQTVKDHVKFEKELAAAVPDSVHLTLRSAAVRPALEESLGRVKWGKDKFGQTLVFDLSNVARYTVLKVVPRAS